MALPFNAAEFADPGDHLVIATALNGHVRLVACRSTALTQEALRIHDLSPLSAMLLGRFLTGAALLGSDLKSQGDRMSMQLTGDGALGGMTVVAEADGTVRGDIVNPHVPSLQNDRHQADLKAAVGRGNLKVIRDLGLGHPYTGTVELLNGGIGDELANYLLRSEQVESVVGVGVTLDHGGIRQAGGILVQLMPGANDQEAAYVAARAQGYPDITYWLEEGFTPAQLLDLFMGDPDIRYLQSRRLAYRCNCSRGRMTQNLLSLGAAELNDLAQQAQGAELICHFCHRHYQFSPQELTALAARLSD
ncbi:MAG: Hsp33 family molecular chaperone HslO [Oscillospiraceae bacterium]|nr:Hsp33 family molecular chaperone HslO [Oscillospiraceae bacterium]MDD4367786.1 Hsp33 family molecular chaperone HslO [Oscillospiraceae bacterium]